MAEGPEEGATHPQKVTLEKNKLVDNSKPKLIYPLFCWESEAYVKISASAFGRDFSNHFIQVPTTLVNRRFCQAFSSVDSEAEALQKVEFEKINNLTAPLDKISFLPILGADLSREVEADAGGYDGLSIFRALRSRRRSTAFNSLVNALRSCRLDWFGERPAGDLAGNSTDEPRRSSILRNYLRLWDRMLAHNGAQSWLQMLRVGDPEKHMIISSASDQEKVKIIDAWLNIGMDRDWSKYIRLRYGLTPDYGYRNTQDYIGRVLNFSQGTISYWEREQRWMMARKFAQQIVEELFQIGD